jgi:hypothetical protein
LILVIIAAANARAIGHVAAEVGRVLVLVAIAGASVTLAVVAVIVGLAVHSKLRLAGRATGQVRATLASHGHRELPAIIRAPAEIKAPRAPFVARQCPHCGRRLGHPYYEGHPEDCPGRGVKTESWPLVAQYDRPVIR